jgi:N-acetylglucosamine malate deacetylase 1
MNLYKDSRSRTPRRREPSPLPIDCAAVAPPNPLRSALRRAKTAVPDDAVALVRTIRSVRGEGPVTGPPPFARALVVAPHPDDEALGCGGTMAVMSDAGAELTVLWASDGGATRGTGHPPEVLAEMRRDEAKRSAQILGARPRFLGLDDGRLGEQHDELVAGLRDAIGTLDPEVVFAPWLLDGTADHLAVSSALGEALEDGGPQVWGYEVWTALTPNRFVDVTKAINRRRQAVAAHETAAAALDLTAGEGLARWRTMPTMGGHGFAEAFLALSAGQYRELAAEIR